MAISFKKISTTRNAISQSKVLICDLLDATLAIDMNLAITKISPKKTTLSRQSYWLGFAIQKYISLQKIFT